MNQDQKERIEYLMLEGLRQREGYNPPIQNVSMGEWGGKTPYTALMYVQSPNGAVANAPIIIWGFTFTAGRRSTLTFRAITGVNTLIEPVEVFEDVDPFAVIELSNELVVRNGRWIIEATSGIEGGSDVRTA